MSTPFHKRLYLRIWLAVVAAVAVLALVASALWRIEADRERAERERERAERPGREIVLRNQSGEIVGQARVRPTRVPGQGPEFQVPMLDGSTLLVQLPRPERQPGRMGEPGPMRVPFGFAWMLGLVALAVAAGIYPIVRRLTKRLETVQQGVERWGAGDLTTRLSEQGQDEVAFLAAGFNHAAGHIEALLTDQKKLLASQKSLLANASHELRSPLARIRMGLELMSPPSGSDGSAALKNEISRNIAELDQLIEEILLASRLDAREADMGTVEAVDMVGLAAEECARVGADMDATSGAALGHSELVVQGVAKLLRRALRNLLENARRHAAGDIRVDLRREGAQAVIRVSDHGPGVPPEFRARIFEPFYRLPGASEQGGGVGLGLALVKSIAERHGGTASCEDNPQGGACFVIRLPVHLQDDTNSRAKT
jgi:two-component system, OmpR family, sensor kinase